MNDQVVLCATCNARCGYSHTMTDTQQDAYLCVWCGQITYRPTEGGYKSL